MTEAEIEAANQTISKHVAETLDKHYPGHAWAVMANIETGIVTIRNLKLSSKMGFILKMDDLATDPTMRLVVKAGGEFLERFNISRGMANDETYNDINYDFKGEAIQS